MENIPLEDESHCLTNCIWVSCNYCISTMILYTDSISIFFNEKDEVLINQFIKQQGQDSKIWPYLLRA